MRRREIAESSFDAHCRIAARFDPNLTFERGAGYGSTSFASRTSLQNQGRATTNSEIQTLFIR